VPVPDFVLRLRERIGHDLLWLPGASAVVLDGERVLLVERSDNGRWATVSGIVDPGEHPEETVVREALEEAGVTCEVEALVWVNVTEPIHYPNGDVSQYLDLTYRCRWLSGEPYAADDESLDARWFPLDGLPPMDERNAERVRRAVALSPR
jgi:8-oxo-dGTP pyrophosphatase MutT (NUDIX family)